MRSIRDGLGGIRNTAQTLRAVGRADQCGLALPALYDRAANAIR